MASAPVAFEEFGVDPQLIELRLRVAELERKLNHHHDQIERTVRAFERGEDLTARINALRRLTATSAMRWSKAAVLDRIREWAAINGEPPTSTEWNPAHARAQGREDMVIVFAQDDWPHASTVQKLFGSWNAAILAAGFQALGPADGYARRLRDQPAIDARWPAWEGWTLCAFFRERAQLTQAALATRAHLSVQFVSGLETGRQANPTIRALLAYCAAIAIRPAVLLDVEEDPSS